MAKVSLMGNAMNTIGNPLKSETERPPRQARRTEYLPKSRHSNLRCFGTPLQR